MQNDIYRTSSLVGGYYVNEGNEEKMYMQLLQGEKSVSEMFYKDESLKELIPEHTKTHCKILYKENSKLIK